MKKMLIIGVAVASLKATFYLDTIPSWHSGVWTAGARDLIFVDIDNDNYLDLLLVQEDTFLYMFKNQNGTLDTLPFWQSSMHVAGPAVCIGDINNDGYMDVVIGNYRYFGGRIQVYINQNGTLPQTPTWQSPSYGACWVGLGDVDLDGDLDLAATDMFQYPIVYYNIYNQTGGNPIFDPNPWVASDYYIDLTGAWGDFDNDGDLDLLVPSWNVNMNNRIYKNDHGTLESVASWKDPSYQNALVAGCAVGDIDKDGDIEWFCTRGLNYQDLYDIGYIGAPGGYPTYPEWYSQIAWRTVRNILADFDGDGDLDLAVSVNSPSQYYLRNHHIYENINGSLQVTYSWKSKYYPVNLSWGVTCGDVDNDGLISKIDTFIVDSTYYGTRKLFYLSHMPIHRMVQVKINDAPIPITDYCYDLYAGWISLKPSPPYQSKVIVEYVYSKDIDLAFADGDYAHLYINHLEVKINENQKDLISSKINLNFGIIQDNLHLSFEGNFSPFILKIFDARGREIKRTLISKNKTIIPLINFPSGIYFLNFRINGNEFKYKIIKN